MTAGVGEYDSGMDITPQVINEIEFHQKLRGYDPDEVDDFLERVAVAVGALQDRVREAAEMAADAERRIVELERLQGAGPARGEVPGPAATSLEEDAETMRRTLVLAQRTADAAVREAEDTASRMITEATERARQIVEQAAAEASQAAEETRQRIVEEISALEEARELIRSDHSALEQHVEQQRGKIRAAISNLEQVLGDPSLLRPASPPELSGAGLPQFPEDHPTFEAPSDRGSGATAEPAPGVGDVVDLSSHAEEDPFSGGVTYTDAEPEDSGQFVMSHEEDEAWARFVGDEGGPPTGPVESLRLDDSDDDAYLAELRKAMLEDGRGGDLFDAGDQRRSRFGRRR